MKKRLITAFRLRENGRQDTVYVDPEYIVTVQVLANGLAYIGLINGERLHCYQSTLSNIVSYGRAE